MKMCQFFTSRLNESVDEGVEDELDPRQQKWLEDLLGRPGMKTGAGMQQSPSMSAQRTPAKPAKPPMAPVSPRKPPPVPGSEDDQLLGIGLSSWDQIHNIPDEPYNPSAGKRTLRPTSPPAQKPAGKKTLNPWELLSKVKQ